MSISNRFEEFNEFDIERGILLTIEKLQLKMERDNELLAQSLDLEMIRRLQIEIENTAAEIKYISSSLLFKKDLIMNISESGVYKSNGGRKR